MNKQKLRCKLLVLGLPPSNTLNPRIAMSHFAYCWKQSCTPAAAASVKKINKELDIKGGLVFWSPTRSLGHVRKSSLRMLDLDFISTCRTHCMCICCVTHRDFVHKQQMKSVLQYVASPRA